MITCAKLELSDTLKIDLNTNTIYCKEIVEDRSLDSTKIDTKTGIIWTDYAFINEPSIKIGPVDIKKALSQHCTLIGGVMKDDYKGHIFFSNWSDPLAHYKTNPKYASDGIYVVYKGDFLGDYTDTNPGKDTGVVRIDITELFWVVYKQRKLLGLSKEDVAYVILKELRKAAEEGPNEGDAWSYFPQFKTSWFNIMKDLFFISGAPGSEDTIDFSTSNFKDCVQKPPIPSVTIKVDVLESHYIQDNSNYKPYVPYVEMSIPDNEISDNLYIEYTYRSTMGTLSNIEDLTWYNWEETKPLKPSESGGKKWTEFFDEKTDKLKVQILARTVRVIPKFENAKIYSDIVSIPGGYQNTPKGDFIKIWQYEGSAISNLKLNDNNTLIGNFTR